jgi:hypothetical protein
VQGLRPIVPKDCHKAHGLEDVLQPLDRDAVIGVKEIEVQEEAWHTRAMQILSHRQNGGTIKKGAASH